VVFAEHRVFGAGVKVEQDAGTVELMQADYSKRGVEPYASRLRMAQLPTPSEVRLPAFFSRANPAPALI